MGKLIQFPKARRSPIDVSLITILSRALKLNDEFLSWALGEGAFNGDDERKDAVIDLINVNSTLLVEAGRKKS